MADRLDRSDDSEFLTLGETRALIRDRDREHQQLAETQANMSRVVALLEEVIKPIRKLFDGNGRGSLAERIVVLENLVKNNDNDFREWVAEMRQKAQDNHLTAMDNARSAAELARESILRETRLVSLEDWRKNHVRIMWAILTPAIGIIVTAVLYGVAHWITLK